MRQSGETLASVSTGHIILTSTQPVGSGWPQRESNPDLLTRSCATELPRPPATRRGWNRLYNNNDVDDDDDNDKNDISNYTLHLEISRTAVADRVLLASSIQMVIQTRSNNRMGPIYLHLKQFYYFFFKTSKAGAHFMTDTCVEHDISEQLVVLE